MGSGRSDGAGVVESRDSRRSRMVARSRSFGSGNRSRTGVPSAQLVVRRFGRGLGGTSGRSSSFRSVGSGGVRILHKCQGASGYRESSSLLRFSNKRILRWSETLPIRLTPQFIMGRHNASGLVVLSQSGARVRMDAQDRGIPRAPEEVASVNRSICRLSKYQCSQYFSPFHDQNALGTDSVLQSWDGWQAYAFPPWSLIPAVLKKLRSSSGVLLTIVAPYWPQRPWFPDLLDLVVDGPVALPQSRDLLRQPHFHRHHLGVSGLSLHAWRLSSDLPELAASPSM